MPDFELRRYRYADRYAVIAELDTKLSAGVETADVPAHRLTEGEVVVLVRVTPPTVEAERGERATERMVHGGPPL